MLTTRTLVLASSSPRRQELLREAGIRLRVQPANIHEERNPGEQPLQYALRLAREKADAVAQQFPRDYVLGADTIVVVDEHVLEKPLHAQDARRMLRMLSGRTHQVTTAVALAVPGKPAQTASCTTRVTFRGATEQEIAAYVATGEPMDKAGAYAIQGGAAQWVIQLEGDHSNVVGLPIPLVRSMLEKSGFFS